MSTSDLNRLGRESYVSLTTFRKSGQPVASPVWAVADGGRLLVQTFTGTGKAKRLRHTARVTVAPCDRAGKVSGDAVEGTARLLDASDLALVRRALRRKYGWQFRLLQVAEVPLRFVRRAGTPVGIAVTLTGPAPVADTAGEG